MEAVDPDFLAPKFSRNKTRLKTQIYSYTDLDADLWTPEFEYVRDMWCRIWCLFENIQFLHLGLEIQKKRFINNSEKLVDFRSKNLLMG